MRGLRMKLVQMNLQILKQLCAKNDVQFLGLFGSTARGEATGASDVDLLVRFSKVKSLFELVRIEDEFREAFGKPVDLVTERSVSPYLIDRIRRDMRVLYEQKR